MFKYEELRTQYNSQIIHHADNDSVILVDSFDNIKFHVRIGTISSSKDIGTVTAKNDLELQNKIKFLTLIKT